MFLGAVEAAKKEGGTVVYGGKVRTPRSSEVRFSLLSLGHKQGSGKTGGEEKGPHCCLASLFPFVRGKHILKNDNIGCMEISGRTHKNLRGMVAFELSV